MNAILPSYGKCYVGQTRYSVQGRWKGHVLGAQRNGSTNFSRAIRKYGPENFRLEGIYQVPVEMLNELEAHYIIRYGTLAPRGYNLSCGGNGGPTHPATCRKLSKRTKMWWAANPEERDGLSNRNKERWANPEEHVNTGIRSKVWWAANPEENVKQSKRAKEYHSNHPGAMAERGRKSTHMRWHVARGITSPTCALCVGD
jgi:hypothetical protein